MKTDATPLCLVPVWFTCLDGNRASESALRRLMTPPWGRRAFPNRECAQAFMDARTGGIAA